MSTDDPAYRYEFDKLAEFCATFLDVHSRDEHEMMLLATGAITAQCASIYKLAPPGGLIDVAEMFRRDPPKEEG